MCNQLSDLGPNVLNVWTLRTLKPVGNSGYYINKDLMDHQVVCEYQDIDIYEVGWIQKFGGQTSWKMATQKTEVEGSVMVIWDVTL
jgi:hypothetical protein